MSYTSMKFLLFLAVVMVLYFRFPRKQYSWSILLGASYFFYLLAGYRYAMFILFTTASTYFAALQIEKIADGAKQVLDANKKIWSREEKKDYKQKVTVRKRRILVLVLVANFGILVFLKYYNMFSGSLNDVLGFMGIPLSVPTLKLFLPLGISFYTFQTMGYLIDVYWGNVKAQRNIAKLGLFVSFFPQIVQGPISMYGQLADQLYEHHPFDFTRFKYAAELILWGFFKKLVVADRAVVTLSAAAAEYSDWNGTTLSFLILLYALQLYADFSGGVDISRGVAQIFGINMIDNFRQPYFANTISEYWHRWHISLGAWFRTYLFYPLAMSKGFVSIGKRIKAGKLGKTAAGQHIARVFATSLSSFVVFLLVGIWHGPNWKYVAFGVWNGGVIMCSALMEPMFIRWTDKLRINTKSLGFRCFQIARTWVIVLIGYVFDIAPDLTEAFRTFWKIATDQSIFAGYWQIKLRLPLEIRHYLVILFGGVVMLFVSIFHEKNGNKSLRAVLDTKPFAVRYILILLCLLVILYYGVWGPGYAAADFVYMQF